MVGDEEEDPSGEGVVVVAVPTPVRPARAGAHEPVIPERAAARPSRTFCVLSSSTPSSVAAWATRPSTCSNASGRELPTASSSERTIGLWASFNQVRNETSTTAATITPAPMNMC